MKRKEYLMFLVSVRDDEKLAWQLGLKIEPKPIEDIRAEFEAEHGSIYIDV